MTGVGRGTDGREHGVTGRGGALGSTEMGDGAGSDLVGAEREKDVVGATGMLAAGHDAARGAEARTEGLA